MAITFKQVQQTGFGSGTTQTVSITPNAAGNLLILGIGIYQKGQVNQVTDNNGNAWIPVVFNYQEGNAGAAIYHVPSCNAGATTITVNLVLGESDIGLIVHEYSGCAQHHAIDGIAVGSGSSGTAHSTGTLTTTQSNDVIFSFAAFLDQNVNSIGGSGTLRSNLSTNPATASGDIVAASPGSYTGQWNEGVSGNWNIMAVGLSPVDNPAPWPIPVQFALTEILSPTSPITATFSNNVTATNAVVVFCMGASTMTWTGVTDSQGNSYSPCSGATVAGCQLFVAFNVVGGAALAIHGAYTGTIGASAVYAIEVRDITNYDSGSGNSGTGTTATAGSITLTRVNEIVLAATINSALAMEVGGNDATYFVIQITDETGGFFDVIEYQTGITGSQNPVANLNGSQNWSMISGGFFNPEIVPVVPKFIGSFGLRRMG